MHVRPMTGNWPLPTGYVTRLDGSRAGWLGVFAPATEWEQDAAQPEMGRTVWPGSLMVEWRSGNERDVERRWEYPLDLGILQPRGWVDCPHGGHRDDQRCLQCEAGA